MSSEIPPRLARAGLARIETNMKPGQRLVLPKGLILTFFKDEILKGMAEREKKRQQLQMEKKKKPRRRYLKAPEDSE